MPFVLVIESDPLWRYSIGRALSAIPGVDIATAYDLEEARLLIEVDQPRLIFADLDGPGGQGGTGLLELLDDLEDQPQAVPIVYTSRDLSRYEGRIPLRPDVVLKQRPCSMSWLRNIVATRLNTHAQQFDETPFGIIDYVQLACSERYSVAIDIERGSHSGRIQIYRGSLWSAHTSDGAEGEDAFYRAVASNPLTRCETIQSPMGPRNITLPWQNAILECAKRIDEQAMTTS
ncbi:MAG: DUF4388 domain-containing protein [Planctomycetota bacterium]